MHAVRVFLVLFGVLFVATFGSWLMRPKQGFPRTRKRRWFA